MRGPAFAVACTLARWLLLASPAGAEQEADPARGPRPGRRAAPRGGDRDIRRTHVGGRAAAVSGTAPQAPGPGPAPAIGIPGVPDALAALGGLDPREWAASILDDVVPALGRELFGAMRGFIDWALGFGDSFLNFATRTPAEGSYESTTSRAPWPMRASRC